MSNQTAVALAGARERLGGKCACCGEDDLDQLEVDYVWDRGHWYQISYGGRLGAMAAIMRGYHMGLKLGDLQLLCFDCFESKQKQEDTPRDAEGKRHGRCTIEHPGRKELKCQKD